MKYRRRVVEGHLTVESLVDSQVSRCLVETGHNICWQNISEDQEACSMELLHLLLTDIDIRWRSVGRTRMFCSVAATHD